MTTSADGLPNDPPDDLMAQARQMPFSSVRTTLTEEVLRRAEAAGDPVRALEARLELVACYRFSGEPTRVFDTFAACLAGYDAAPGEFGPWFRYSLCWDYKWLASVILAYPEISLDQAYATLADMESRYAGAGYSLRSVHQYRCAVARHVGHGEVAAKAYTRWVEAATDELSDCAGCEPTAQVEYLASAGRDEDAVELSRGVLGGESTCAEQPHGILTAVMLPLLRIGLVDQAIDAHRQAYRAIRSDLDAGVSPESIGEHRIGSIATHLEFCAATGNERRGLDMLRRHLALVDSAATPGEAMRFAGTGALILTRLVAAGRGDLTVRRKTDYGTTEVGIEELADELRTRSLKLAARFDIRNGTSARGEEIRRMLRSEPVIDGVEIGATYRRRRPTPIAPAAPATLLRRQVDSSDLDGLEVDQLIDVAEDLWRRRQLPSAATHLRRLEELATTGELSLLQSARATELQCAAAVTAGDDRSPVEELWLDAADRYRLAGEEDRRQQALGRLGALRCQRASSRGEPVDDAVAMVEESTEHLWDAGGSEIRAAAGVRLVRTYLMAGRRREAMDLLEPVGRLAEVSAHPIDVGDVAFFRAQLLSERPDRLYDAVAEVRRARDVYRYHDRVGLVWACLLHAELITRQERTGEPTTGYDERGDAVGEAAVWTEAFGAARGDPSLVAQVYLSRGRRLLELERTEEATDDLVAAVSILAEAGDRLAAAVARVDLARGLLACGERLGAAESAEEALAEFGHTEGGAVERRLLSECRLVLAGALAELGERTAAAREFGNLARLHLDAGEPIAAATCHELAGELLERADLESAGPVYALAGEQFATGGDLAGEVRCRRRHALVVGWAGDVDRALGILAGAEERLTAAGVAMDVEPEPPERLTAGAAPSGRVAWELAALTYAKARMLASGERYAEASATAQNAVGCWQVLAGAGVDGAADRLAEVVAWRDALRLEQSPTATSSR